MMLLLLVRLCVCDVAAVGCILCDVAAVGYV